MPANVKPPSLPEFLDAYEAGATAKSTLVDTHDGSRYDIWGGVAAVLFAKAAQRARANFRNVYFDNADDAALDDIVAKRYPDLDPRVQLAAGVGTCRLQRPSGGSSATVYAGTRIGVVRGRQIKYYVTGPGNFVFSSSTLFVDVPIFALEPGPGSFVAIEEITQESDRLFVEDVISDATIKPVALHCAEGTSRETSPALQARVRAERLSRRPGYAAFIEQRMRDAGAAEVRLFASDFLGGDTDHGLNRVYVADASFTTTAELLLACRIAAFDAVTCGMNVQVLPLTTSPLQVTLTAELWDDANHVSLDSIINDMRARAVEYIAQNPFIWRKDVLGGVARAGLQDVADITVETSTIERDADTVFGSPPLVRWTLAPNDCAVIIK